MNMFIYSRTLGFIFQFYYISSEKHCVPLLLCIKCFFKVEFIVYN